MSRAQRVHFTSAQSLERDTDDQISHTLVTAQSYDTGTMFSLRTYKALPRATRAFSTTSPNALARMQLIGRLADTPEHTSTATGRDLVRYALGVSVGPKDENGQRATNWFRVASFTEGAQRELLTSLPKG